MTPSTPNSRDAAGKAQAKGRKCSPTAAAMAAGRRCSAPMSPRAVVASRHEPALAPPRRHAFVVYAMSVVAMLVLIRLATTALGALAAEHLRPAAIAVAVGLHFLPFAWAFPATSRLFGVLGAVVAALGGAGLLLGLFLTPTAGAAAAVLAGLTMLALITLYNLRH